MTQNSFGSGERVARKGLESTAQESAAMNRYIDLQAAAYNALMSNEERIVFEKNVIELAKLLNEGKGMNPDFCRDILIQLKRVETDYLAIKKVAEATKQLERESRGDVLVPHLYDKTIALARAAIESGVPESALQPLERTVREYAQRVRSLSRG